MPSIPDKVIPGEPIKASAWNELIDYVRSMTPQPGAGMRITRGASGVTFAATPGRGARGGGSSAFPFQLYGADAESPSLAVRPGRVCQLMAKVGAVLLTADPAPLIALVGGEFSVFVKVAINQTDEANDHRSGVASAVVVTDNDAGVTGDIGGSGELDELTITWTDDSRSIGHFYVKLADVSNTVPAGSPPDTAPTLAFTQFLRNNIETIVVAGDDAIILVAS